MFKAQLLLLGGDEERRQTPHLEHGRLHSKLSMVTGCNPDLLPLADPNPHPAQRGATRPILSPFSLPRGNLEVIYPELGDVGCTYIPTCHQSRWRISREWGSPQVLYPQAKKVSAAWVLPLLPCNAIIAQVVLAASYY